MKVIRTSEIVRKKVKTIQSGYTAFAETKEVCDKVKQELNSLGIEFIEEATDLGSWFIPKK